MMSEAFVRWLKPGAFMLGTALGLGLFWALTACQPAPARAIVTATPARPDTQIQVTQMLTQTLLDVVSRSGIGQADVHLTAGTRPPRLILRLHLRGLEQFRLIYDDSIITAAVGSVGQPVIRQQRSLVSAPAQAQVETLRATSRFWLPLRLVTDSAAEPRIPLENGFFELEASPDLLASDVRDFRFEWIDFFR